MIILQKTYTNGVVREIAVTAVSATDDATTVILSTTTDGALALCQVDEPDLWAQLEMAGGLPA